MRSTKELSTEQLGHLPFSKEKLEVSKIHHDNHGEHASVPSKGNKRAIPNDHWEMHYDLGAPSKNMKDIEGSDFNPKCANERKTTHLKVNKEDH